MKHITATTRPMSAQALETPKWGAGKVPPGMTGPVFDIAAFARNPVGYLKYWESQQH